MNLIAIAIGISVLAIGIAVAYLIATLRRPYNDIDKTESPPILLPEFRPGGSEVRHVRSSRP